MFPSPSTMSSSSASPMSEPGPSPGPSAQKVKQRRPNRSCDTCRTRKIRCNAPKDAPCSNCVDFGATCTYLELPKKRGPKNRLVDELRKQNASLEARLRAASVCALCSQPLDRDRPTPFRNEHTTGSHMISPQEWNEDNEDDDELTAKLSQFSISAMKNKYFGTVSTYSLANNAIQAKETKVGRPMAANYKRMVFWQTPAWEKAYYNDQPHYTFPEDDLMVSLVQLYFDRIHPTFPILHRPTFQRSLAEGLHFRDPHFATMLLALLAMASRHSNDPRVFADGYSAASAGWKFVAQTQPLRKTFEPSIYHVQFYALMTLYLIGTALPQACWFYLGLGIRFLQQRGQHRTKRQPGSPDPESELWNRAFWAFICLDRTVCAFIGRPLAFHIEDYEVDPPLEVDDEYWDQGFVQPPGVPSAYSFFVYYLQYSEILADAIRRLYATRRTKARMGWIGKEWEQQILAELDSALEALSTSLPIHLRWNPENMPQDPLIMDQAATLHIVENYVTILIHRPFIQRNNELATRSHSVCIRAARSILHTAGAWFNRLHRLPTVHALNPCFVSNLILLMSGNVAERDLALIEIGMQIIKFSETRWQSAGRFWDMLTELRSLDRQPRAQPNKMQQRNIALPRAPTGFATQQTSQHSELFNAVAPDPLWYAKMARSAQPPSPLFKPGMSIEQLLANTGPFQPLDFTLDDQMMDLDDRSMSTWMSTPMHLSDLRQWDAYIGSMNAGGGNRPQWAH